MTIPNAWIAFGALAVICVFAIGFLIDQVLWIIRNGERSDALLPLMLLTATVLGVASFWAVIIAEKIGLLK